MTLNVWRYVHLLYEYSKKFHTAVSLNFSHFSQVFLSLSQTKPMYQSWSTVSSGWWNSAECFLRCSPGLYNQPASLWAQQTNHLHSCTKAAFNYLTVDSITRNTAYPEWQSALEKPSAVLKQELISRSDRAPTNCCDFDELAAKFASTNSDVFFSNLVLTFLLIQVQFYNSNYAKTVNSDMQINTLSDCFTN